MKRLFTFIAFIICLCCATYIYAQSNLYKETKQIQGDGYTYQCKVVGILAELYNTNQQFVELTQKNRKTGENSSFKDSYTPQFEQDTWTRPKCYSIVRNAFSEEEKQRLKAGGGACSLRQTVRSGRYRRSGNGITTDTIFVMEGGVPDRRPPAIRFL